MKFKHFLYLFLFAALPLFSFASKQVEADALYAKGHYKEAMEAYKKMLAEGNTSASLYYNLGNACFKVNEIPSAILYYEKAHRLAPGDEDINFNIRFANQRTADRVEEPAEFFLTKWWHGFILAFSLSALSVLSVVFMLLASSALIWYLFTQSVTIKKASFYTAIALFVIALTFVFMGNRQAAYFNSHHQAIIFSGSVNVRSTPAADAKTLFIIHEGTKVEMLDKADRQIRIKLLNGSQGWISAADVQEI